MSEALLELEDARFGYDGRVIVHVACLTLRGGETTVVMGPNGAGKSTLMRGILGLLPLLGGVRRSAPGLRLGFVPQRDAIDPLVPMTAADVVALGTHGRLRAWQRAGTEERSCVHDALAACDALEIATQRWGTLSGGQRQRVLIARALAVNPHVLVLDEPTSGIDVETEARILARIDAIRRERGLAVCIVSHREETLAGRFEHRLRLERGETIAAQAAR